MQYSINTTNKNEGDFLCKKEDLHECEGCGLIYDYADEPAEVKEGGIYMCPTCWAKEE